jgi:HK97 family phage prohead protease
MKTFDLSLETKAVGEAGEFEGYASTFGNVDQGGDVVEPGAFMASIVQAKKDRRTIPMLWQHDQREPIGFWKDIAEDAKGLYVKGQLLVEDDLVAKRAYGHLKAKSIGGLSIGYRTYPGEVEVDDKKPGVARLKKIDLREISLVTMPMNVEARVTAVKASDRLALFSRALRDGEPPPVKEFEDILREAGVPRSMAVQIASVGYAKAIRRESEGDEANDPAAFLRALLPG